jgi:TPP-dependent pyruvate/acetoin dehydrogenase alpha subunit
VNRSSEDLKVWRQRDPISRLSLALITQEPALESVISQQQIVVSTKIDTDWEQAEKDPVPLPDTLLGTVYSKVDK